VRGGAQPPESVKSMVSRGFSGPSPLKRKKVCNLPPLPFTNSCVRL